jgi:uncharacterized protein
LGSLIWNDQTTLAQAEPEPPAEARRARVELFRGSLAGNLPADDVSNDVDSAQFSLSMAGHPFFVIGLHAHASRLARRFSHPVLVFNSHRQFEKLREDGRYGKMQSAIRLRDIELQGSLNPNLADFGEGSEARQYSGREVEAGWRCPFDFSDRP